MNRYFTVIAMAILLSAVKATAQMPYKVTVQNDTYTPLTGATSINGTKAWTDSSTFVVPLGFNFNMDGKTVTKLNLLKMMSISSDTTGVVSGMSFMGTALLDRGVVSGTSKSPIRYTTTGNAGKRIFKLEIFNAGFSDENDIYQTLNDSLNLQVWLYEGTNAIELRYGPSKISHYSDYFFIGGPMLGYMKNVNLATESFEKLYLLKGDALNPVLDSVATGNTNFPSISSYPVNGRVYNFTPKNAATGVAQLVAENKLKVYPTLCTDKVVIENGGSETLAYEVISMNGSLVIAGNAANGLNTINVSTLPGGMYVLRLGAEGKAYRFMKQ